MTWHQVLTKPERPGGAFAFDIWFARIATVLLKQVRLLAGGEPHRLVEIEVYFHGPGHQDMFAHRDPIQIHVARWYFHRTHGAYRGGSFKGLDLTFGQTDSFAGVLIRSIEKEDGSLIVGPSLTVDHLLRKTGHPTVVELDRAIGSRLAWDSFSPLTLVEIDAEDRHIWRTARVGLSLKRVQPSAVEAPLFLLKPYRFLTEPRRVTKGKTHLMLALHEQGKDPEEIRDLTGSPLSAIKRYVEQFDAGRKTPELGPFFGRELRPADLCRLHGVAFEQRERRRG